MFFPPGLAETLFPAVIRVSVHEPGQAVMGVHANGLGMASVHFNFAEESERGSERYVIYIKYLIYKS